MIVTSPASQVSNFDQEKKVLLIDFNDSFTYNIVAELYKYPLDILVVKYADFKANKDHFFKKIDESGYYNIFLGPGPGRPDDYLDTYLILDKYKSNPCVKFLGICLGHQILMTSCGFVLSRSKNILHGQCDRIDFSNWQYLFEGIISRKDVNASSLFLEVVRYNSLCVLKPNKLSDHSLNLIYSKNNEVMGQFSKNILSMQFHPESVGTNYPHYFFDLIYRFMS